MGFTFYSLLIAGLMSCQEGEEQSKGDAVTEEITTEATAAPDEEATDALLGTPVEQDSSKLLLTRNYEVGDTIVSPSGLKLILKEKGNGAQANAGDKVSVHYAGRFPDGKEFDNSFKRGQPIPFTLGRRQVIPGWDEGIAMMRVGDKATLLIPSKLGYGPQGRGSIPPNADLIFEVELVDVTVVPKPVPFDVEGKEIKSTPEGLKYVIVEENDGGTQAYANKRVAVHYTGYLPDGTIFDSSIPRGKPYEFTLGQGSVISGWDIGIRLMKTGDKLRLIIPPNLAYGERGAGGVIPPNATLIFDVELVSVQ